MAALDSPRATIAVLAEASPTIGTGHVVEAVSIARAARRRNAEAELWVNHSTPTALLARAPCPVHVAEDFSCASLARIARTVRDHGCQRVLTSFRRVMDEQVAALRRGGMRVGCLDELGDLRLDCDLVINPALVPQHQRYVSGRANLRMCCGPAFMPLAEEYAALHRRARSFEGHIRRVVMAMGGVDRTGATLRLIEALTRWPRDATKHVVLGAGFAHRRALDEMLDRVGAGAFVLHERPASLGELLASCDVAFTAGGDTLYELACVGTPALVLFEDAHEHRQGQEFEARGFGRCVGAGSAATAEQILGALDELDDPQRRAAHSEAGRALVDGRGAARVIDALLDLAGEA
ncbi:MAG: hypothetical protein HYU88_03930 [Chloroflexi bacterium]|nr:hypothetical protein [Chloroflexota bacterium]